MLASDVAATLFEMTATTPSEPLLYGTMTNLAPVASFSISLTKCGVLPPPAVLSAMRGCPSCLRPPSAAARAMRSWAPPAEKGATNLIGWSGHAATCAAAGHADIRNASAVQKTAPNRRSGRFIGVSEVAGGGPFPPYETPATPIVLRRNLVAIKLGAAPETDVKRPAAAPAATASKNLPDSRYRR